MVLQWLFHPLRHRARRRLLALPFPAAWLPVLERLPFYRGLDARGQQRIRDDLRVLIAEKNWEGCGGLVLTDEMKVTIAAQASLLLLDIEHEFYADVKSILVYPSAYKTMPKHDEAGVVRAGQTNLGEAWKRGPVVLAWDAARGGALDPKDGHNLVFHEFAHQLDMLDGLADGTPPLGDRGRLGAWATTMTAEFRALRDAAAHRRATLLDKYGATNPAEFFAVATECFFEKGRQMRDRHASLYAAMRDYYHQDPAARQEGAGAQ
jgi:Mlc titration factor MtfA (ptsG expression regulator)